MVDSSSLAAINNVSLVLGGDGPEGCSSVPVKHDNAADNVLVAVAATSAPSESDGKAYEGGKSETDPEEELKKNCKKFESKIVGFEEESPSFHVQQPLSVAERENWHNYLNSVERDGDLLKVFHEYERFVVACANYPEYWIRYVLCMKARGRMDLAKQVLASATNVYVKGYPEIHLFAAEFNEQNDDLAGARASFKLLHSEISPGHLEAVIRHANMELRKGNLYGAFSVYDDVIAAERGKRGSTLLPLLYAQYSKFAYLVLNDPAKAKTVVAEALGHVKPSKELIRELLFLESILPRPQGIDQFKPLIEDFISIPDPATSNERERESVSITYIGFLRRFRDFDSLEEANWQHAILFIDPQISDEENRYGADEVLISRRMKRRKIAQLRTSQAQDGPPAQKPTIPCGADTQAPTGDIPPQTYPTHTSQPVL